MTTPVTVADPTATAPAPVPAIEPKPVEPLNAIAPSANPSIPAIAETQQPEAATKPNPALPGEATDPASLSDDQLTTEAQASAGASKSTNSKSKKKKPQVTVTMATTATPQSGAPGAQGENTGRWTAEEHRLFLAGLEQHGKGWKKIASLIKSRTVVQIRTHAQKYFQKLAKARQNGEEGEISMEGRGGTATVPAVTNPSAQPNKRRQISGTKRKAIRSVVSSAQNRGKKLAKAEESSGEVNPAPPLPAVAPALSPYVLPAQPAHPETQPVQPCIPNVTTTPGAVSGPALEDSLFRFLSPAPVVHSETQVNEVARQAGANPITVPPDHPATASSNIGGEVSPTGVADYSLYPSWTDAKDTPSWYAKGLDVDALLDVADPLDWITDSGDLHESYQPTYPTHLSHSIHDQYATSEHSPETEKHVHGLSHAASVNNMSMNTLPHVDSAVEVPPLPSLFDGATESVTEDMHKRHSMHHMHESHSSATMDEHLQVFDSALEEHDFVSTILENTGESSGSLPVLG